MEPTGVRNKAFHLLGFEVCFWRFSKIAKSYNLIFRVRLFVRTHETIRLPLKGFS
jgi:hypothetical protein